MGQLVQSRGTAVAVKVDEAPSQYLTFALGSEMFAVGILKVNKVLSVEEIAPLTGTETSATELVTVS